MLIEEIELILSRNQLALISVCLHNIRHAKSSKTFTLSPHNRWLSTFSLSLIWIFAIFTETMKKLNFQIYSCKCIGIYGLKFGIVFNCNQKVWYSIWNFNCITLNEAVLEMYPNNTQRERERAREKRKTNKKKTKKASSTCPIQRNENRK